METEMTSARSNTCPWVLSWKLDTGAEFGPYLNQTFVHEHWKIRQISCFLVVGTTLICPENSLSQAFVHVRDVSLSFYSFKEFKLLQSLCSSPSLEILLKVMWLRALSHLLLGWSCWKLLWLRPSCRLFCCCCCWVGLLRDSYCAAASSLKLL